MEEQLEVKKAIIPVGGLGTRFLPLSRAVPKEFFPLVDKPVIQYIMEEVFKSGINDIVFVTSPRQKMITEYFKKSPELEKLLIKRKKDSLLKDLKEFEAMFENTKLSFVTQKLPGGDGHAILQAAKTGSKEPVAVSFGDDVFDAEEPALLQLINVFKTCNAPVIGLKSIPKEKITAYAGLKVEKIANRLYKIKKIKEKPSVDEIESTLTICGKYVLTPEVFEYLKNAKPSVKGEIILAEVFEKMLLDGKVIYGYEIKGDWLECGDKLKWIKSFFHLALKDPKYKEELKAYLKTMK